MAHLDPIDRIRGSTRLSSLRMALAWRNYIMDGSLERAVFMALSPNLGARLDRLSSDYHNRSIIIDPGQLSGSSSSLWN